MDESLASTEAMSRYQLSCAVVLWLLSYNKKKKNNMDKIKTLMKYLVRSLRLTGCAIKSLKVKLT